MYLQVCYGLLHVRMGELVVNLFQTRGFDKIARPIFRKLAVKNTCFYHFTDNVSILEESFDLRNLSNSRNLKLWPLFSGQPPVRYEMLSNYLQCGFNPWVNSTTCSMRKFDHRRARRLRSAAELVDHSFSFSLLLIEPCPFAFASIGKFILPG
jgi:hypothetical protein